MYCVKVVVLLLRIVKETKGVKGDKGALRSQDINGKAAAGCSRLYVA